MPDRLAMSGVKGHRVLMAANRCILTVSTSWLLWADEQPASLSRSSSSLSEEHFARIALTSPTAKGIPVAASSAFPGDSSSLYGGSWSVMKYIPWAVRLVLGDPVL